MAPSTIDCSEQYTALAGFNTHLHGRRKDTPLVVSKLSWEPTLSKIEIAYWWWLWLCRQRNDFINKKYRASWMTEWEHRDEFPFPNHPSFNWKDNEVFIRLLLLFMVIKRFFHNLPPFAGRRNSHGQAHESDRTLTQWPKRGCGPIKSFYSCFPPLSLSLRHFSFRSAGAMTTARRWSLSPRRKISQLDRRTTCHNSTFNFPLSSARQRKTIWGGGRALHFQYATVISDANSPASVCARGLSPEIGQFPLP